MASGYPPEFRGRVLDLIASGRKVTDVARDLGVSEQTIYNWRAQDLIERGERPGLRTAQATGASVHQNLPSGAQNVSVASSQGSCAMSTGQTRASPPPGGVLLSLGGEALPRRGCLLSGACALSHHVPSRGLGGEERRPYDRVDRANEVLDVHVDQRGAVHVTMADEVEADVDAACGRSLITTPYIRGAIRRPSPTGSGASDLTRVKPRHRPVPDLDALPLLSKSPQRPTRTRLDPPTGRLVVRALSVALRHRDAPGGGPARAREGNRARRWLPRWSLR
jgi:transposase-like protein